MQGLAKFMHGVKSEIGHIKWPGKKDMISYSIATVSFIVFFALYFLIIDVIFTMLQQVL